MGRTPGAKNRNDREKVDQAKIAALKAAKKAEAAQRKVEQAEIRRLKNQLKKES